MSHLATSYLVIIAMIPPSGLHSFLSFLSHSTSHTRVLCLQRLNRPLPPGCFSEESSTAYLSGSDNACRALIRSLMLLSQRSAAGCILTQTRKPVPVVADGASVQ